jgi:hypothetical protein
MMAFTSDDPPGGMTFGFMGRPTKKVLNGTYFPLPLQNAE